MNTETKFIDLVAADALQEGKTLKVSTAIGDILLANVEGKIYAVDDMCTHEDSSLSLGCLKGNLVSCTLHGSRFDVCTGEPMEEPATEALRRYAVRMQNNRIQVCLTPLN